MTILCEFVGISKWNGTLVGCMGPEATTLPRLHICRRSLNLAHMVLTWSSCAISDPFGTFDLVTLKSVYNAAVMPICEILRYLMLF